MSKPELLKLMRLLSALESVMLTKSPVPAYLLESLDACTAILEREILK